MPGAKDVAVEFTSMSKTYSMAGWRIGFAVGNKTLIAALTRVKSYLDYGAFTPIQAAACAALNGPQDIVEQNRQLYQKRRDVMVESFGRAGLGHPLAQGIDVRLGAAAAGAEAYGQRSNSPSSCSPTPRSRWRPASATARRARASCASRMVENEQRLRQAARNVKRYLQSMGVNSSAA